jgi:hypothetical protein
MTPKSKDIEVAPRIFQSVEDYEANHKFDEARDNELQDQENINPPL